MKEIICPSCQRKLPPNSPLGLCPVCVLKGAKEANPAPGTPAIEDIQPSFPDFEIKECIGRGGMGIVYRAYQLSEDRQVALKILDPSLSEQADFAERFEREARTLGKLNHPNIVAIYDHGKTDDLFWLTMELVDGVNLRQAMQTAEFTPQQALEIIPGLCSALQYAHENDVFHRDVKPENILLDTSGKVKVADFGIARLMGEQSEFTLTRTGSALGSTAYMAPEQIESPQDVDHRADIYSLGVVFYEMLTGSLPLGRFPAPSEKTGSHPGLDEVVFRALEKEREKRFQHAGEIPDQVRTASHVIEPKEKSSDRLWTNCAVGSWLIGSVTALVGANLDPLLFGLGAIAAIVGLPLCWWLLLQIRQGNHPRTERRKLMWASVYLPSGLLAICSMLMAFRMVTFENQKKKAQKARDQAIEQNERAARLEVIKSLEADVKLMLSAASQGNSTTFIRFLSEPLRTEFEGNSAKHRTALKDWGQLKFVRIESINLPPKLGLVILSANNQEIRFSFHYEEDTWKLHSNNRKWIQPMTNGSPYEAVDQLSPLSERTPEALLKKAIYTMMEAAEQKDGGTFLSYLMPDFQKLMLEIHPSLEDPMEEFAQFDVTKLTIQKLVPNQSAEITFSPEEHGRALRFQYHEFKWKLQMPTHIRPGHLPSSNTLAPQMIDEEHSVRAYPDYSSPIATLDTTLRAAKAKDYAFFEEAFTTALLKKMEDRNLNSIQVIEQFLSSPVAKQTYTNRFDFRDEKDPQKGTLTLKNAEQKVSLKMVRQSGKWRFAEPFFLIE